MERQKTQGRAQNSEEEAQMVFSVSAALSRGKRLRGLLKAPKPTQQPGQRGWPLWRMTSSFRGRDTCSQPSIRLLNVSFFLTRVLESSELRASGRHNVLQRRVRSLVPRWAGRTLRRNCKKILNQCHAKTEPWIPNSGWKMVLFLKNRQVVDYMPGIVSTASLWQTNGQLFVSLFICYTAVLKKSFCSVWHPAYKTVPNLRKCIHYTRKETQPETQPGYC